MRDRRVPIRAWLLAIVVLLPLSGATAQNDAGSGGDAGNKRGDALLLGSDGEYAGALVASDVDWYAADRVKLGAGCVSYRITADAASTGRAVFGTAGGQRTMNASLAPGDAWRAGVASSSIQRALLRTGEGPTDATMLYSFRLRSVTLSQANIEGSSDAGDTLSGALDASQACFGGSLGSLAGLDTLDLFRVAADAGDTLYYSLASSGSNVTLRLLDATGTVIGYTVDPDVVAGYYIPATGDYYLAASSSSVVDYAIGLSLGPDPGSGCRPQCFLTE